MTVSKNTRRVVKLLAFAQIASDRGKWNVNFRLAGDDYAIRAGYNAKPLFIIEAIKLINSTSDCGVHYYVDCVPDQNGYTSVLVYFDIKLPDGSRYQVSFHNPGTYGGGVGKFTGKGRPTHWIRNHSKSAPDSVESVYECARKCGLNPVWLG